MANSQEHIDAAQQQPDAFDDDIEVIGHNEIRTRWRLEKGTKLYTSPPAQRTWVGLTLKEIQELKEEGIFLANCEAITEVIEAKLKEKNT